MPSPNDFAEGLRVANLRTPGDSWYVLVLLTQTLIINQHSYYTVDVYWTDSENQILTQKKIPLTFLFKNCVCVCLEDTLVGVRTLLSSNGPRGLNSWFGGMCIYSPSHLTLLENLLLIHFHLGILHITCSLKRDRKNETTKTKRSNTSGSLKNHQHKAT